MGTFGCFGCIRKGAATVGLSSPKDGALHLGTHNGSNTREAVQRASEKAMDQLFGFLGIEG